MKSKNYELTKFMNKKTFTQEEIKKYPYEKRKEYIFTLTGNGTQEQIKIYSINFRYALRYCKENYDTVNYPITSCLLKTVKYKELLYK